MSQIQLPFIPKALHVTPTGVKLGSKGRVMTEVHTLFDGLDKGQARQLRKQLHRNGKGRLAKTGTRAYQ